MDGQSSTAIIQKILSETNFAEIIAQEFLTKTNVTDRLEAAAIQKHEAERLARCRRYSSFMGDLPRSSGEAICWLLLLVIVICLSITTLTYSRTEKYYK
jgi:hypothetical protein